MDTARQFIPMAPVCTVTADQVVHDFQGDIPAGVKFRCPSCDRPVQFHRGSRASTTSADASVTKLPQFAEIHGATHLVLFTELYGRTSGMRRTTQSPDSANGIKRV